MKCGANQIHFGQDVRFTPSWLTHKVNVRLAYFILFLVMQLPFEFGPRYDRTSLPSGMIVYVGLW